MAVQSAKQRCFASIYLVEKTVNDIEKAKKGNKILKARMDDFRAYADSHEAELKEDYAWERDLEQWWNFIFEL